MSLSEPIDEITLAALRRQCRSAQERVYRRYAGAAWTLAVRVSGCEATAWDTVHNGFLRAFERIAQLEQPERFGPWLRRIVVNQVMDAGRRALPTLPTAPDGPGETPDADAALDLQRALDQLGREDRAVLWLHDAEGLTHAEIARTLGQSVPWSKTRLSRVRARVRDLLDGPSSTLTLARSASHGQ